MIIIVTCQSGPLSTSRSSRCRNSSYRLCHQPHLSNRWNSQCVGLHLLEPRLAGTIEAEAASTATINYCSCRRRRNNSHMLLQPCIQMLIRKKTCSSSMPIPWLLSLLRTNKTNLAVADQSTIASINPASITSMPSI